MNLIKGTVVAGVLALGLSGCSLFGVDPVDSEDARQTAERVVTTAQFVTEAAGVLVTKHAERCATDPAAKLCDKPELTQALVDGHASLSARLADLRALVDAGSTDAEQLAGGVDLVFAAIDDVTRIMAAYNSAA